MSEAKVSPVPQPFPLGSVPVTYADGVLNVSLSPSIAKFYLFNIEPSLQGRNEFQNQPTMLVTMPIDGFVATAVFFNRHVEVLLRNGQFPKDKFDAIQRALATPQ